MKKMEIQPSSFRLIFVPPNISDSGNYAAVQYAAYLYDPNGNQEHVFESSFSLGRATKSTMQDGSTMFLINAFVEAELYKPLDKKIEPISSGNPFRSDIMTR